MESTEEKVGFLVVILICAIGCSMASCDKDDDGAMDCAETVDDAYSKCVGQFEETTCTYWMVTVGNGSRNEFTVNRDTWEFYKDTGYQNSDVCYEGEK